MKKILATALFLLLLLPNAGSVFAQTNNSSTFSPSLNTSTQNLEPGGINGLAITPLLTTQNISKSSHYAENITLFDYYSFPVSVTFQVATFVSGDQYGNPQFTNFYKNKYQDSNLEVTLPNATLLPPHKYVTLPFEINTTQTTEPGEYYIAIFANLNKDSGLNGANGISVNSSVGSLFLLTQEGNVRESGYIKSFNPQSNIITSLPVNFLIDFKNTGTVHLIPQGRIEIYNMFGHMVGESTVNSQRHLVLPVGVNDRILTTSFNSADTLPGYYTAQLYLTYGSNTVTTANSETSFWYIPTYVIYIAILIVGLIILWAAIKKISKRLMR